MPQPNHNKNKSKDDNFLDEYVRPSIKIIASSCPDEWNVILEYIENQANQKTVHDNINDNIAARWAYAYSRIRRILLTLSLKDLKE